MHNDLSKFRNTFGSIRKIVVTASLVTAIGLAGVVGARTVERKPASKQIPGKSTELLHEISTDTLPQTTARIVTMEVTAYCACPKCCGPEAIGLTASGKDVSYNEGRFVAADRALPFGTKLMIPGYSDEPVEVIDRGGAINGDKLDVFFPTHEEALEWGRRKLQVTILD